jgi:monoamine oxidase
MESIWSLDCEFPKREYMKKDLVVQAVVIGSGMAGLLTAYMLKKMGLNVVVLEGSVTAGGITKNTTAKITSQHHLIYDKLIQNFGVERASVVEIRQDDKVALCERAGCEQRGRLADLERRPHESR